VEFAPSCSSGALWAILVLVLGSCPETTEDKDEDRPEGTRRARWGAIERSIPMAGDNIRWRHSLEEGRAEAGRTGRLVLIDLFNPG
jgi:hypothetical protein